MQLQVGYARPTQGDIVRYQRLIICLLVCVGGSAFAQDEAEIRAFNEAWDSYNDAKQTSEVELQIQSSENLLDVAQSIFDPADERLPLVMLLHGRALIEGKRHDEARIVLKRSLELSEELHGKKSPLLVSILFQLAKSHNEFQDSAKQRHYRRAKKILELESGTDSEAYAAFMLKAGADILSSRDVSASKSYLKIAHESFQTMGDAENFRTGVAALYLGKVEFSRRKFKASTTYLLDALTAFQGDDEGSVQYQLYTRALIVQAYEYWGKSDLATEHCVAIGRVSPLRANQDYQPLFRMAPTYPNRMLSNGAEGFVDVVFTVDESGFTKNPEVFQRGRGDRGFEKAAIEAVKRFRYAPRFESGEAIAVDNIKTRISFELVD